VSPEEGMTRRRFVKIGGALTATVVLGGSAAALATQAPEVEQPSTRIGEGTMKTLVVYGTKSGCTTGIAQRIGETLARGGSLVDVKPAKDAGDPSAYDAVVVGSGVRAGQWHEPVRSWVEAHAASLKERPVAFYTCGLMITEEGKAEEVLGYTDPIIAATGIAPVDIALFAGWNDPKSFGFAERTIMKLMKAPQGDFRDWDAIDAWAEKVSPSLSAG